MPRLMSVALTEDAVRERRKTVTRRLGWKFLKPGDRLTLCRKVMGRKSGEELVRICDVQVVSVRREPLGAILDNPDDVRREGFQAIGPLAFIAFFCQEIRGVSIDTPVTRIEWKYL